MNTRVFSAMLMIGVGLLTLTISGELRDASRRPAESRGLKEMPEHTEIFKFTAQHGADFLRDKDLCLECHGADFKGGIFKSSCLKCHPVLGEFKHFSGDILGSHGQFFLKNPKSCKGCHGGELQGAGSAMACVECHQFPHSQRWGMPDAHGVAFLKEYHGEEKPSGPGCLDCHQKSSKRVSCSSCHLEIPHAGGAQDWAEGGLHAAAAVTYEGKCARCHREYKANMPVYESCKACHPSPNPSVPRYEPISKWVAPLPGGL